MAERRSARQRLSLRAQSSGGGPRSKKGGGKEKPFASLYSWRTAEALSNMELTTINFDLVADLVGYLVRHSPNAGEHGKNGTPRGSMGGRESS